MKANNIDDWEEEDQDRWMKREKIESAGKGKRRRKKANKLQILAITSSASSSVLSMCCSVCAVDMKAASNWAGAR